MPGNLFPARYSSMAPPPVDTWSKCSNLLGPADGVHSVAPASNHKPCLYLCHQLNGQSHGRGIKRFFFKQPKGPLQRIILACLDNIGKSLKLFLGRNPKHCSCFTTSCGAQTRMELGSIFSFATITSRGKISLCFKIFSISPSSFNFSFFNFRKPNFITFSFKH